MSTNSIMDFIYWLGTNAGIIAVLSLLNERWAWFQEQSSKTRQIVSVVLAILLPEASLILLNMVPPDVWAMLEPHFQALVIGLTAVLTVLASEAVHELDKAAQARSRANK